MNRFKISYLFVLLCVASTIAKSQDSTSTYRISLNNHPEAFRSAHLKLGGTNAKGESYAVNNYYMSANGKPVIPVTGEFHYARYPHQYWEESILKMRAGGVNVIATYVFWNIHEEKEGAFNWDGDNNLRAFVALCAKNKMPVVIRIGPFCHGEIRNGGLPDWLLGKALTIRSNDPEYLKYVERLYNQIGIQLKGLLFKDGGPVFAIQIENEFQHSASPWGITYPGQPYDWTAAEQDKANTQAGVGVGDNQNPYAKLGTTHMFILKSLAVAAGLDVPIYTATGWGYAAVLENECIPVTSCYPYPTWADKKPSVFYQYKDIHNTPDYSPVRYKPEDYPNFTAEIGGGIMATYGRRPMVPANSIDAVINRFIGSGANGVGYYMYHGGASPRGQQSFFSDEAYAYPKISYDFQAPIGEFGQIRPSFNRLKLIHYFLSAFGDILAPMQTSLPLTNTFDCNNTTLLRYAVRSAGNAGFVFMLNFQDHLATKDINNIKLQINTGAENIDIPEKGSFTLKADENAIFPFNFNLGTATLQYATAQLLTGFENNNTQHFVFFAPDGIMPEFAFDNAKGLVFATHNAQKVNNSQHTLFAIQGFPATITMKSKNGKVTEILVLDRKKAETAYISEVDTKKVLIFSDALALQRSNGVEFVQTDNNILQFEVYPKTTNMPVSDVGTLSKHDTNTTLMSAFEVVMPEQKHVSAVKKVSDNKLSIQIPDTLPAGVNDYFLHVDYQGDAAMAFRDGNLVADDFYYGKQWQIGLKKFIGTSTNKEMVLYFRPLYPNAPFYQDFDAKLIPDFSKSATYLNIKSLQFTTEYKALVHF